MRSANVGRSPWIRCIAFARPMVAGHRGSAFHHASIAATVPLELSASLGVLGEVVLDPGAVFGTQRAVHVPRQQFVEFLRAHAVAPRSAEPPSRSSSSFRQFLIFWRAWNRRVFTVFSGTVLDVGHFGQRHALEEHQVHALAVLVRQLAHAVLHAFAALLGRQLRKAVGRVGRRRSRRCRRDRHASRRGAARGTPSAPCCARCRSARCRTASRRESASVVARLHTSYPPESPRLGHGR